MSAAPLTLPRRLALQLLTLAQRQPAMRALVVADAGGQPCAVLRIDAAAKLDIEALRRRCAGLGAPWALALPADAVREVSADSAVVRLLPIALDTRGVLQMRALVRDNGRWRGQVLCISDSGH